LEPFTPVALTLATRKLIKEEGYTLEHKIFLGLKLGQRMIPDLEGWDVTLEENQYDKKLRSLEARRQDENLPEIKKWLGLCSSYNATSISSSEERKLTRTASHFYLDKEGRFYRRNGNRSPQLVVGKKHRMYIMIAVHNCLGHQEIFATTKIVTERFWWPDVKKDIA